MTLASRTCASAASKEGRLKRGERIDAYIDDQEVPCKLHRRVLIAQTLVGIVRAQGPPPPRFAHPDVHRPTKSTALARQQAPTG